MPEYATKEKLTRKDIIIELIREISKKALVEFKGGYTRSVIRGDHVEEVYVPDSRKEYIQGIEFLSDVLLPEFDTKMKEEYKKINEKINGFLKEYEDGKIKQIDYVIKKLKIIRTLFQELMIFLERIKFWKKKLVGG